MGFPCCVVQVSLTEALVHNEQLRPHLSRAADDLHPLRVRALFERIPAEDLGVLDLTGRPEDLVRRSTGRGLRGTRVSICQGVGVLGLHCKQRCVCAPCLSASMQRTWGGWT